jgi:hypothetical protein
VIERPRSACDRPIQLTSNYRAAMSELRNVSASRPKPRISALACRRKWGLIRKPSCERPQSADEVVRGAIGSGCIRHFGS